MANEIEVGAILEGKVTGITKFGAFVSLPGGKSGLVHISEIAYSYVSDVNDHLSEGQDVKVKVINIDENNRINLSIKQAQPRPSRPAAPKEPRTFDDMLKQFMSDSDSKLSGRYDKPSSRRRNNGRKG